MLNKIIDFIYNEKEHRLFEVFLAAMSVVNTKYIMIPICSSILDIADKEYLINYIPW